MKHRRDRKWLALPLAVTAALLAGLAAPQAHAGQRPDSGGWQSYLEQPDSSNVQAVSATVLSGNVSNARGLTAYGHGDTTLTVPAGGAPATVLLDYGVEVEGSPYLNVESYSGTALAASLAFTEAKSYLRNPSGAITGDSAFQARSVSLPITATSTLTSGFMGGFRFEAITLSAPGTVVLSGGGRAVRRRLPGNGS